MRDLNIRDRDAHQIDGHFVIERRCGLLIRSSQHRVDSYGRQSDSIDHPAIHFVTQQHFQNAWVGAIEHDPQSTSAVQPTSDGR